jgi:hypothetical protein
MIFISGHYDCKAGVIDVPKSRWPELSEELEEKQVAKEPQSLWEHCTLVS